MNKSNATLNVPPIRITFFGDSTCVGQGVSIYRGWVTQIAQYLDEYGKHINREILVTNASVNGRTTRQALEDMPYHVQSHGVDILVVQFGLNDCNYWATDKGLPRVSRLAFIANLREIVARGERSGAFRILLNNNHPTSRNKNFLPNINITYEDSNHSYNEATRSIGKELTDLVSFQDIENWFNKLILAGNRVEKFLLDDGLHLSNEGHSQYFSLMCPIIRSAIDDFVIAQQAIA